MYIYIYICMYLSSISLHAGDMADGVAGVRAVAGDSIVRRGHDRPRGPFRCTDPR